VENVLQESINEALNFEDLNSDLEDDSMIDNQANDSYATVSETDADADEEFHVVKKIAKLQVSNVEACKVCDQLINEAKEVLEEGPQLSFRMLINMKNIFTTIEDSHDKRTSDIFLKLQAFSFLFHHILNSQRALERELASLKDTKDSWQVRNVDEVSCAHISFPIIAFSPVVEEARRHNS